MEETKKFDKQIIIDFAKKHYKKLIAASLAIVILVVSGVLLFQHNNAPKIEDVYDRMVYLIEASQEVNALIYGCGVPVWEDDSEYVEDCVRHRGAFRLCVSDRRCYIGSDCRTDVFT